MILAGALYALAAAALGILGLRSIVALRDVAAPWTIAGWATSTAYCAYAVWRLLGKAPPLPLHAEYVDLAIMAAAFVVAGVRREPQATPWWWPVRAA